MSQPALQHVPEVVEAPRPAKTGATRALTLRTEHQDVAGILARMSFPERVRAYRNGVFSAHELSVAAAREPDRMPILNDEFEWIAVSLADLD
ncbi:MAG TPA: hypothetical protein VFY69_05820 [Solirubrobacterales bacterium]|nr:hypothetical protein [Solirubrobacterales bacterium]